MYEHERELNTHIGLVEDITLTKLLTQYQSHGEEDGGAKENQYLGRRFNNFLAIAWKKARRNPLQYNFKRRRMSLSKAVLIWSKLFASYSYNVKIYVLS